MANKRVFKKTVKSIGSAICDEMMIGYYNINDINQEAVEKAITDMLCATYTAISNSNTFFGKSVREFDDRKKYNSMKKEFFRTLFDKILADFRANIDSSLKIFNAAIPEDFKQQNKSAKI